VHQTPHGPLRSRVLSPDAGHAFASRFGREGVRHDDKCCRRLCRLASRPVIPLLRAEAAEEIFRGE
jgi:hypothetical protein